MLKNETLEKEWEGERQWWMFYIQEVIEYAISNVFALEQTAFHAVCSPMKVSEFRKLFIF